MPTLTFVAVPSATPSHQISSQRYLQNLSTRSSSFLSLPTTTKSNLLIKPASTSPFFTIRASSQSQDEKSKDNALRELIGMKRNDTDAAGSGAASSALDPESIEAKFEAIRNKPKWKIRLQLTKPVTWIPLIWGVICGAAASGNYHWLDISDISKVLLCMVLSGPLLTGYTQTINDWYDRDIDAINEPYRPIPSGAISETEVKGQIAALLGGGLVLSLVLDLWQGHLDSSSSTGGLPTVLLLSIFGSFISYIYSAPPLKLKQNGWVGNYALGASYISLPWWAGQALFGSLDWKVMLLTLFYSFSGLGIAVINDFKSIEGDRQMGLQSLPVAFGVDTAKWICVGMIDVFQLLVAIWLAAIGEKSYAAAIVALVLPQMYLQKTLFLKDPIKNDVKYQAAAQPFLVIGILVAGLAVGHHGPL